MTKQWERKEGRLERMTLGQKGTQTEAKEPSSSDKAPAATDSVDMNLGMSNEETLDAPLEHPPGELPPNNQRNRNKTKMGININEFDIEDDSGGEDGELDKEEEQTKKFLTAIADASATDRYIQKVGYCDGSRPEKTLTWLRAIDRLPDEVQLQIALLTSEASLQSSIRELKNARWQKIKTLIAKRFVNANFAEAQKEALDRLEQRPGESVHNYITTFEILLNEAYNALPENQTSLIRTFLSGLSDRELAKRVAKKKLETLPLVVKEVRQQYQDDDLLRPRRMNRVHFAEAVEDPQIMALSSAVGDLVKAQKETSAQIAALATTGTSSTKQKGACYRCGKNGHFARECRTNPIGANPTKPKMHNPSALAWCQRCRRSGHMANKCMSGPPRTPCFCGKDHWVFDCPKLNISAPKLNLNVPPKTEN